MIRLRIELVFGLFLGTFCTASAFPACQGMTRNSDTFAGYETALQRGFGIFATRNLD